jgi:hypothetical protein
MSRRKPPIVTKNKEIQIPHFEWNPALLVDKTISIIGPSGTRKTTIVKQIMNELKDHVEQCLVVNATELANKSYSDIVDPLLIHTRPWLPDGKMNIKGSGSTKSRGDDEKKGVYRFLDTLWKRQEMMVSIYRRANNLTSLHKLYDRIPDDRDKIKWDKYISLIKEVKSRTIAKIKKDYRTQAGECAQKIKEVEDKFEEMLILVYKKFIIPNIDYLKQYYEKFSEDEKYSFQYIDFNPRILVIFDDCAAELKTFFNKDIFRKMFYQNRHPKITFIICCQDDTDLPPNLKKNAFLSIYTDAVSSTSNFERKTSGLTKNMQKDMVDQVIPAIFKDESTKLVFYRADPKRQRVYYVNTEIPPPFKFGSAAINELCNKLRVSESTLDTENPFYSKFKVN